MRKSRVLTAGREFSFEFCLTFLSFEIILIFFVDLHFFFENCLTVFLQNWRLWWPYVLAILLENAER